MTFGIMMSASKIELLGDARDDSPGDEDKDEDEGEGFERCLFKNLAMPSTVGLCNSSITETWIPRVEQIFAARVIIVREWSPR